MDDEMGLAPLAGDFYNFQNLLTTEDQEIVGRVRRFFEEKIAPREARQRS
jgi:glutaryl-CoA dehydrogenase